MTGAACQCRKSAPLLANRRPTGLINFVTVGGIRQAVIYKMKLKFVCHREEALCRNLMEAEPPYELKLWR